MTGTVRCSLCGAEADNPPVNGIVPPMPDAWATVVVAPRGDAIRSRVTCPACTTAVRGELARLAANQPEEATRP